MSGAIKETYDNKDGLNSLVEILGVTVPKIDEKLELSQESSLILKAIEDINSKVESVLNRHQLNVKKTVVYSDLNLIEIDNEELKVGDRVFHHKFKEGEIKDIIINLKEHIFIVVFKVYGRKKMVSKFSKFMKIID